MSSVHKTTGVVSGDVRSTRAKVTRWVTVGITCLVLLGAAVFAAVRLWPKGDNEQPQAQTTADTSQQKLVASASEKYMNTGQMDQAESVLVQALSKATNDTERENYLLRLGSLYETRGDFAKALETYKKAEVLPQATTKGVAYGMARSADRLGDKTMAIDYYRQTHKLVDRSNNGYENDLSYIESRITALGGVL